MVAARSNTLTGLLIAAPVLYSASSQTDEILKKYFNNTFSLVQVAIRIIVPEAISGFATILIVGWIVAFSVQTLRYAFFRLEIGEKYIKTSRGFLNRFDCIIPISKINAIQIKQSIIMQFMQLKSAYINAVGVQIQKGDIGLIVPADTEKRINSLLDNITEIPLESEIKVRPVKTEFMSFLWLPIFAIGGDLASMYALNLLGYFGEVVRFALIIMLAVFGYWVVFRIHAYFKSALTVCDKAVKIDYFEKLNFTRTYIPYHRIQFVKVYQSVFQRSYKTANVKIYVYSNKKCSYRIKNLKYDQLMQVVKIIEERI